MPAWLIEAFASALLTRAFWFATLMTVPAWLGMVFLPKQDWVRRLCHPLVAPVCYALVWGYLCYQAWTLGLPEPTGTSFSENRDLAAHPMVFLAGWTQLQVLHLFLGCWIYRDALKRQWSVPAELLGCWLFGPLGLIFYALRVALTGKR